MPVELISSYTTGMLESIVLGIVQGIFEWLPVSSEGMIVLIKSNFFPGSSLEEIVRFAFFLHIGTFFAALIYFREEVKKLFSTLIHFSDAGKEEKSVFKFILFTTLISGVLGMILLKLADNFQSEFEQNAKYINLTIGILLIITGFLQLKAKSCSFGKTRNTKELSSADSLIIGIMQGFSSLPGLSRSGLTVVGLLFRKYSQENALRLSFLLSLPIVLLVNVVLNYKDIVSLNSEKILAVLTSFVFGLLTIHILLKIARKINFGYFVLLFAGFLIISFFV